MRMIHSDNIQVNSKGLSILNFMEDYLSKDIMQCQKAQELKNAIARANGLAHTF